LKIQNNRQTNTSTRKISSVLHETWQNLTKIWSMNSTKITGMIYLISMIHRMQAA